VGVTGTFQGDVHGDILQPNQDNVVPTTDGLDNVRHAVNLSAGAHSIKVQISPDTSNAPVQLRLNWYTPEQRSTDHDAAIVAASHAKLAVVFVWARRMPAFALAGEQNKLVEEVCAVNPNTIVVLNTSQPVALPLGEPSQGDPSDVVARRRGWMGHREATLGQDESRGPPADDLGDATSGLPGHGPEISRALR